MAVSKGFVRKLALVSELFDRARRVHAIAVRCEFSYVILDGLAVFNIHCNIEIVIPP